MGAEVGEVLPRAANSWENLIYEMKYLGSSQRLDVGEFAMRGMLS